MWDIFTIGICPDNATIDSTAYDDRDNFGYAFCKDKTVLSTIVGSALISSNNYGFYPIDNSATTGDVKLFDTDGFTDREKLITLSSGVIKTAVPYSDISFVVSAGPFSILANQSIDVGFSIAAGSTIDELRSAIKRSRDKYPNVRTDVKEEQKVYSSRIFA